VKRWALLQDGVATGCRLKLFGITVQQAADYHDILLIASRGKILSHSSAIGWL